MKRPVQIAVYILSLVVTGAALSTIAIAAATPASACTSKDPFCFTPQVTETTARLDAVSMPKIATPAWLSAQGVQAQATAREVTYQVASRGTISSSLDEFATQISQTLNGPEGWARLGIRFVRVESGGQFTAWLSEASQVPSFSPSGCDAVVSCTVGNNVIINETRWLNGSDAWNAAGGSLRDYRHMVVNHETGHWLGHGHEYCAGPGQIAPVMQQQTMDMQGCKPNPWPQSHELYAPKLGIRS